MAQIITRSTGIRRLQTPTVSTASSSPAADVSDDSDEWEYEYSTTETETYYVTLDLTIPNFNSNKPTRRNRGPAKTYLRSRWTNPGLGRNGPGKYLKAETYGAFAGNDDEENDGTPEPDMELEEEEVDEEEEDANAGNGSQNSSGDEGDANDAPEISILDLHSDNPMMSYNRSVFSCQWATNVGTELLFMAHDRDSKLPILRKLVGDVDLLAASSARIISNPVHLEARKRKRSPDREYVRGSNLQSRQRLIPVGQQANDRRKDQATFLENIMSIKDDKGEEDDVTIVVEKRLSQRKWKAKNKELREAERRELKKTAANKQKRFSDEDVAQAQLRLVEMDEEDIAAANLPFQHPKRRLAYKNAPGKKPGRKAKGVTGADAALAEKHKIKLGGVLQPRQQLDYSDDGGDDVEMNEGPGEDEEEDNEDYATPEMRLEPVAEEDEQKFYSAESETRGNVEDDNILGQYGEDGPGDYDEDEDAPGEYDETQA